MEVTTASLRVSATAAIARTSPRTGGTADIGLNIDIPIGCDIAWKNVVTLLSPGDSIVIDLTNGEITNATAVAGMQISGAFAAFLPPAGISNGKQSYATDANSVTGTRTYDRVRWVPGGTAYWQIERYTAGTLTALYRSTSDVATPNLATGWVQTTGATTSAPTVATWARTVQYDGGTGTDINGDIIPEATSLAMLLYYATGTATLAHTGLAPTTQPLQLWRAVNGEIDDALTDSLTITATSRSTTVNLLALALA